jgi:photosystem II stability/assembly factor-like uncharacterized protein
MAVAVTVTLLISLMVGGFASPAAAKDLDWSKEGPPPPGDDGDWFWDTNIDAFGPMGMAIDGTIYTYLDHNVEGDLIMKSTDGGHKWEDLKWNGGAVVDFAFSTEDADAFWVADATTVYRTTDGGRKFTALTTDTDEGTIATINALAVGYYSDEAYLYFAGDAATTTGQDVFMLGPGLGANWLAQSSPAATAGGEVYEVFCSPNFNQEADPLVMMVAYDGSADTGVYMREGGGGWKGPPTDEELCAGTIDGAIIDVPDDFDSAFPSGTMEFFVAVDSGDGDDGGTPPAGTGGVYWYVTDQNVKHVFGDADCVSLEVAGEVGTATVMAGGDDGKVYYNGNYGGGKWDDANPAGDADTYVLVAQDYLDSNLSWALVNGANQALGMSTDGRGYPSVSLIDANWDYITDFTPGSLFVAAQSTGGADDGLWRGDGPSWERIAVANSPDADSIDFIAFSPDGALFYADSGEDGNDPKIFRSNNNGDSFQPQNGRPDNDITAWLILDDTTIMVGYNGGIQMTENNGTTWGGPTTVSAGEDIVSMAASPDYDADETILVGTADGEVFRTKNKGKDWKDEKSGDFSGAGNTYVAFDPGYADNGIFYAAGSGGDDLQVDIFKDMKWANILDEDDPNNNTVEATGLVCSPDGTLYATADEFDGMFRCINPSGPPPEIVWDAVSKDTEPLAFLQLTGGSNVLWGSATDGPASIFTYTDTMTGSPSQVAPSDGSSSDRTDSATVSWNAMPGAKEYEVKYDTDPGFKRAPTDVTGIELTSTMFTALDAGQTYYWKVRATKPVYSRWSATWAFTTDLGAGEWNPFIGGVPEAPANGATNVPLQPSFAWNAADWATGYEFVLATDAAFTDAIVSKTGANALTTTVYMSEQALEYSTTYYWKVRAVSKTSGSEWATAVFTTEGEAPPPPTAPPVVTPTPVDTTTPVYIWVIIGIGAALVIAVIILIVRTRRVA